MRLLCGCMLHVFRNNSLGPEGPSDPHGALPHPPPPTNTHSPSLSCEDWADITPPFTLWLTHRIFYFPLSRFFFPSKPEAIHFILQWSSNSCGVTHISSAEKSHQQHQSNIHMCKTLIVHYFPAVFSFPNNSSIILIKISVNTEDSFWIRLTILHTWLFMFLLKSALREKTSDR